MIEEEDDDKLSFTSPTSNTMARNGFGKRLFNEKDENNSMSVSKIEEVNEQNQTQTRLEIQELQDYQTNGVSGGKRGDFSFSIEKDRYKTLNESESKPKRRKKKETNSRNHYSNNMIRSKQERENMALNELTNVLNQHY